MICKHCGTEIDLRSAKSDGTITCPGCGAVYRRKSSIAQQGAKGSHKSDSQIRAPRTERMRLERDAGRVASQPHLERTATEQKRRKKKGNLVVVLLLAILLVASTVGGIGIIMHNKSVERNQAANPSITPPTATSFDRTYYLQGSNASVPSSISSDGSLYATTASGGQSIQAQENNYNADIGPVMISGDDSGFTLYQVNQVSGEYKSIFQFSNVRVKNSYGMTVNKYTFTNKSDGVYIPCYTNRQLFSDDLTKLAVNWHEENDDSYHVGWVDKNGKLIDITSHIHPLGSGFSSKIPKDNNALFSPDGYFFYCDNNDNQYHYIDINTLAQIKETPRITNSYGNMELSVLFMPDGSLTSNFSGKKGVNDNIYCVINGEKIEFDSDLNSFRTYDLVDNMVAGVGIIRMNYSQYQIGLYGEGYTEKITDFYGKEYYYHVRRQDPVFYAITPETDYIIESCAYHDGEIAFSAKRGQEYSLFITAATENSEPRKIGSIDSNYNLFFWR